MTRARRSPRLTAMAFALAAFTLLGNLPSCTEKDRFECGVRVGEDVSQCDGANEICVCGERRCARYDASCQETTKTDYRYTFGDEACVPASTLKEQKVVVADPTKAEANLCPEISARPEVPETCGAFDRATSRPQGCSDTAETCVCTPAGGTCARSLPQCASGYSAGGECVPLGADGFVLSVGAGELCPSVSHGIPCGTADENGRLRRCGDGFVCACSGGTGYCARRVDETTCAAELLIETDTFKQCATNDAEVIERGLCPSANEPPPIVCGTADGGGRLASCNDGERCACTIAEPSSATQPPTGTCTREVSSCSSGLEFSHNGRCMPLSAERATLVLPLSERACPAVAPEERSCGRNARTECAEAAGCVCDGKNSACVVDEVGCDSRLAYAESRRCVKADLIAQVRTEGACEPARDDGQGGSGGEGGQP